MTSIVSCGEYFFKCEVSVNQDFELKIVILFLSAFKKKIIFFRFVDVQKLGNSVLKKDPKNGDVKGKLHKLHEDEAVIDDMWQKRMDQLQDAHDLQVIIRGVLFWSNVMWLVHICV